MSDFNKEIAGIKARLEKIEDQLRYLFRSLGVTSQEAPAGGAIGDGA